MDPQIKKRMNIDIIVYPFQSMTDGDKIFGDAITIKGYVVPKFGTITTKDGKDVSVKTAIYIDGNDISKIHDDDEIESFLVSRQSIKSIGAYPSLFKGYEVVEVLL